MTPMQRLLAALALSLGLTAAAWSAGSPGAVVPHAAKPAFPVLNLPDRAAGGQRAIDLLGSRLPEVAAWYGKSPDEFRALLLKDPTHRIDKNGRLFVVDELVRPLPAMPAAGASTGPLDGTLAPLDQTFLLHSKPGAKRTIYLNFKGATLTGTAWNNGSSITALPYDLDGVPYTFSTTELQRIQYIWQRVAEDYAPFDVDVTTEAVTQDLISRSSTSDDVYGTTVLITHHSGVYNCSCGGVAYVGVFDATTDAYKPALVFYDMLGAGNEKYVAEAISHEAGHNVGLSHDGTATDAYYLGQGSGNTGWAPIMGAGYYQPLVQWSKGEYAGANNLQDDYAVMQSNGLPLRADDHGNTAGTATVLLGVSANGVSTVSAEGVIERPDDVDQFAFSAAAGTATLAVSGAARSSNVDLLVTLRNGAGQVLATANPVDALNATISVVLPVAGTYYLAVQGTGNGDPQVTGYSSYGSLGQYAVSGSFASPAGQPPVAVIAASTLRGTAPLTVNLSGTGSSDADGSVVGYAWTFGDGTTGTGSVTSHVFSNPGSYEVQLRVTDNSGLSATSSVTITADPPVLVTAMRVADIAMGLDFSKKGSAQATAAVKVVDANGLPVTGAVVSGSWSGLVSRNSTATTDGSGIASFTSPGTRRTSGTFVFTVNDVALNGYAYAPQTNTETTDSIAR